MMANTYLAFGLRIHSCIPLPELIETEGMPDVYVRFGVLTDTLPEGRQRGVFCFAAAGRYLFRMPGHARFLVTTDSITIDPCHGADGDLVRLLLLRSCFGILLQMRGFLVLRGSAVEFKGKGIAIAAQATSGGSTLAAAMLQRGGRLISDELCVIRVSPEGTPELLPFAPRLHLWKDMVKALGMEAESLPRIRYGLEKFSIPVSDRWRDKAISLDKLYSLSTYLLPDTLLEPINRAEKLNELLKTVYCHSLSGDIGAKLSNFKILAAVSKRSKIWRLKRPDVKTVFPLTIAERIGGVV